MHVSQTKQPNSLSQTTGFTLIEIMVVVITLGVIASLALSNYNKVLEQSYCRSAQMNLMTIYNAAEIYRIKNSTYILTSGSDLAAINTDLKLNLVDTKFSYNYFAGVSNYSTIATRNSAPLSIGCQINGPTPKISATNPSCWDTTYCSPIIGP